MAKDKADIKRMIEELKALDTKRMYLNCYALSFPEDCGLRESSFFLPPLWLGPDDGKPIVLSSPKKGPSRLRGKEG